MASSTEWQTPQVETTEAATPMGFETPGESFPGSAFYYLADEPYVPLPVEAHIRSDGEERPAFESAVFRSDEVARPLVAGGSAADRARAQQCLTMAIYYEAASESDAGQRAVAQVVLNRVAHPSYPGTVCGVVFQGSERDTGCQFTFTCDGSLARRPAAMWWDRAAQVARAALAGAVYAPVGLATHYHTVQIHPYWAPSLDHVTTIGAHRFYRWRGAAGQKAAFRAVYRGGEPIAAPHPRTATPVETREVDPLSLAETFTQAMQTRTVENSAPTLANSGAGDGVLGSEALSGSVLPAYERSGQWLVQPGSAGQR